MKNGAKLTDLNPSWWKETIVYQIYPRSFQDSNNDGIGDLRGLINRLDYIAELGVETLWLNPIFSSPNDDNGYDISDYRNIMDEFGTMEDFEELVREAKKRNLRILMDLVLNHSSDEHAWFHQARKSKDSPYRDYYYWKESTENGQEPNNWVSYFAPSAWEFDEQTQEYYLHIFSRKQPDLNWENPQVRQEIYDIMHFWMNKGIDGFRLDAFVLISKDLDFPDCQESDLEEGLSRFYGNGPRMHEFLQELHQEVISKYDMMTVGEGAGINSEEAILFTDPQRKELHMIYHFDHMTIDKQPGQFFLLKDFDLTTFKKIITDWDQVVQEGGWNAVFLGNHDFPRILSRFGNDGVYKKEAAKLLCILLLTQRGTPFLYYGDEIGMSNVPWESLDKFRDIYVFDGYEKHLKARGSEKEFLQNLKHTARDNGRTPMQWNTSLNAGFTDGLPWIEVNPNFEEVNVETSLSDPDSILNFYKKMIQFRKSNSILVYGDYQDLCPEHPSLFIYSRKMKDEAILVVLNMSEKTEEYSIPNTLKVEKCIISNYHGLPKKVDQILALRPWEARIYEASLVKL